MKKLFLSIFCLLGMLVNSQAQFDASNLFGGANVAYAKPIGKFSDHAKGGFSGNLAAGYKLTEKLGIGIQYQTAITVAIDTSFNSGLLGLNAYGLSSYLAKGWYVFVGEDKAFKPYAGLGLGLARVAEPDVTVNNETFKGARRVGFGSNVELGFLIKNFNLSYSFNMGGKTPKEPIFNGAAGNVPVFYHTFNIGYIYNL